MGDVGNMMTGLAGAMGIPGAITTQQAQEYATNAQTKAIAAQRQMVWDNLDPAKLGPIVTAADRTRALSQLALQKELDPQLYAQRYGAEADMNKTLNDIVSGTSPSDVVAQAATANALQGSDQAKQESQQLIDAALGDLKSGATLPPDLEAQMVQAGLERAGQVTGSASGEGVGGTILRSVLGTEGLKLQEQRRAEAQQLMTTAGNLQAQRQQILQSLFPSLKTNQLQNLGAASGVLGQSSALAPQSGLTGTDVANLWLSRVGSTNQLMGQAAQVAAQGALAQAQIRNQMMGSAGSSAAQIAQMFNQPGSSSAFSDTSGAGGVPPQQNALTASDLTLTGGDAYGAAGAGDAAAVDASSAAGTDIAAAL